jgi:hypothetical protein
MPRGPYVDRFLPCLDFYFFVHGCVAIRFIAIEVDQLARVI